LIDLSGPDVVLAAITSVGNDPNAITLETKDFHRGKLNHPSFIHPTKLFTAERGLICKVVGSISEAKRKEVVARIASLLK